ncbi:glutamate racemase [Patescibacteria group bacterium]
MLGIFDSGVGGLSVMKELITTLPDYQITYFGDTARVPYGNKSKEIVTRYALEDADFLIKKGAKIIVVACSTATAFALDTLTKKLDIPVIGVAESSIKAAIETTKNKNIGVIGTKGTIGSEIYQKLAKKIDPKVKVYSQPCPLLVPLVEENWIKKPETRRIIKKYLRPLKTAQIDTLILGCTHYPLLEKTIQGIAGKKITLISPGEETAKEIQRLIDNNSTLRKSLKRGKKYRFYASDTSGEFKQIGNRFLGRRIGKLSKANVENC